MRIFNPDSPFMTVLSRIADLILINIFTMLLCLPVITAGSALTACYYACLKIKRDEDSGLLRLYFKSFKENFRQATILWLIMIVSMLVPLTVFTYLRSNYGETLPAYLALLVTAIVLLIAFLYAMVFPVQGRFVGRIGRTLKTAIYMSVSNPPRTFLMIIMAVAPFALALIFPVLIPIPIMFGFSLPAFLSVCMYDKQFKRLEEKTNELTGKAVPGSEDEHIFSDDISDQD